MEALRQLGWAAELPGNLAHIEYASAAGLLRNPGGEFPRVRDLKVVGYDVGEVAIF